MPWCPSCKLEYVEGIKICPDCKSVLVDSLDDSEDIFSELDETAIMEEIVAPYIDELPDEETRIEMMERIKRAASIPKYSSLADSYDENKSGAYVLFVCGALGIILVVMFICNIIHLPLNGFSATLTKIVMGLLFLVFLISGIRSLIKMKDLKPQVVKEKEKIDEIVEFIKAKKASGEYSLDPESEDYEEKYLLLCEKAVSDIDASFEDLEPGFSFFVVDRFAGDILDEN